MFDPTHVWKKVVLAELYDPVNQIVVLSNPPTLDLSIAVETGELQPVGWSSGVDMYGHTKSVPFDLPLRLSAFEMARQGYETNTEIGLGVNPVERQIRWLSSFAYPRDLGVSPAPLLVVWPNIMSVACKVRNVNISYKMFDNKMGVRLAEVTLSLTEMRQAFKTAISHQANGFFDEGHSTSRGAGGDYKLGAVLKFR
jgi:hypothetical protein